MAMSRPLTLEPLGTSPPSSRPPGTSPQLLLSSFCPRHCSGRRHACLQLCCMCCSPMHRLCQLCICHHHHGCCLINFHLQHLFQQLRQESPFCTQSLAISLTCWYSCFDQSVQTSVLVTCVVNMLSCKGRLQHKHLHHESPACTLVMIHSAPLQAAMLYLVMSRSATPFMASPYATTL